MHDDVIEYRSEIIHEVLSTISILFGSGGYPPWHTFPREDKDLVRAAVRAVTEDDADARHLHELWVEGKKKQGWRYGFARNAGQKTHPMMVDYDELSSREKFKDEVFVALAKLMEEYAVWG